MIFLPLLLEQGAKRDIVSRVILNHNKLEPQIHLNLISESLKINFYKHVNEKDINKQGQKEIEEGKSYFIDLKEGFQTNIIKKYQKIQKVYGEKKESSFRLKRKQKKRQKYNRPMKILKKHFDVNSQEGEKISWMEQQKKQTISSWKIQQPDLMRKQTDERESIKKNKIWEIPSISKDSDIDGQR